MKKKMKKKAAGFCSYLLPIGFKCETRKAVPSQAFIFLDICK